MIYRLFGALHLGVHPLLVASVGIPIPQREIAARDMNTNPMAALKDVARWQQLDCIFIDFTGLQQLRRLPD